MAACENCGRPATMRWASGDITCDQCRPAAGTSATAIAKERANLGSLGLLTREQAAQYLSLSVDAFDDHVRPNVKERLVGRKPMFAPAELDRYADAGSQPL